LLGSGIGLSELLLASLLVAGQAGISLALSLGLERRILISALRAAIQLSLVGFVLHWVFLSSSPWILAFVLVFMTLTGTHTVATRIQKSYPGIWLDAFVSISVNSLLVLFYSFFWMTHGESGYQPQEVIPMAGILIGNSISGITLALDQFTSHFQNRRDEVETWLSHGATRWEAMRGAMKDSIRTGLTPILNSMSVAGLVSLPGALTGQLLAGADPMRAARYQIVILMLILCATYMGSLCAVGLAFRRVFTSDHQLSRSVL
jgi:putative ABC transport system permease protein